MKRNRKYNKKSKKNSDQAWMDSFAPSRYSPAEEKERRKIMTEIARNQSLSKLLMGFFLLASLSGGFIWLAHFSGGISSYIFGYFLAAILGYAALLSLGVLWQKFIQKINRDNS